MADNNFRRGPHAAKNKVNISDVASADERKTVVLDEDLEGVEFEDRVWLYWTRNKSFIITSIVMAFAIIVGVQGYKIFKKSQADALAAAYEQAVSQTQLLDFAKKNSGTLLAGVATLQVADEAYAKSDFKTAASFYEQAKGELGGSVLYGRAILGYASSIAMQDAVKGKDALKAVYENINIAPAYRAQAGYMFGLLEKSQGKIDVAKEIFKAMSSNTAFGIYSNLANEALSELN